jgi:hypothetical protein
MLPSQAKATAAPSMSDVSVVLPHRLQMLSEPDPRSWPCMAHDAATVSKAETLAAVRHARPCAWERVAILPSGELPIAPLSVLPGWWRERPHLHDIRAFR